MRLTLPSLLAMLLFAACHFAAAAAPATPPVYRVSAFSDPSWHSPWVFDINNRGQIVGEFIGADNVGQAYVSVGGVLKGLGAFNGHGTWATGINDAGAVVGNISDINTQRAFLYSGGVMREIGTLGGTWSNAAAINNAGQVVGISGTASGAAHAFLYQDGHMRDLSALAPPGSGTAITPYDINERGEVTGGWTVDGEPRAFVYTGSQWRDLGTVGGMNATARRINDSGAVTGDAITVANRDVAFWYTPDSGMHALAPVQDGFQVGRGINNRADLTGDGYSDHGPCCTFFTRDGVTFDLDALLEPNSGWSIYQAVGINNGAQIAGYGCHDGIGCTVVRLDPVPEPSTWAMLLAGLGLLWWTRRRPRAGVRPMRARRGAAAVPLAALALLPLLAATATPATAAVAPAYTVTAYPPGEADARATDINNQAHLLGIFMKSGGPWYDQGVPSPFLSTGPHYVDLGAVMGSFVPADLNGRDQVAGTATVGAQGRHRAYLYQDGGVSNLGTLGGNNSGASAINDAGEVVGYSSVAGGADHAFLYHGGTMYDIATLGVSSHARDINNRAQVVGDYTDGAGHSRAFVFDHGAMRDLGTLGGMTAAASAIGDSGHVVGSSTTADGVDRSFLYFNGAMTTLAGDPAIRALDVNSGGEVVGARVGGGAASGAYLWADGAWHDVAALVNPASGWQVYDAVAINDRGQIAATGCLRGSCSAVVLAPVPEPSSVLMLLAGLAVVGVVGRARRA